MEGNELAAQVAADVAAALAEDIGGGDLSAALIADTVPRIGRLYSREKAVLCGRPWFEACFTQLDAGAIFIWHTPEGGDLPVAALVCEVRAAPQALLSGERCALNFLQTLSATATAARRFQQLAGATVITDTRKTLPKLRAAQKYAVRIGGAHNHRQGLFDEILIKENHAAAAGGIAVAVQKARTLVAEDAIQVEVHTAEELDTALAAGAQRILLDNFSLAALRQAVQKAGRRAQLEASGGVTEATVAAVAATGVARISVGALTKHVRATDFSFIIAGAGGGDDV